MQSLGGLGGTGDTHNQHHTLGVGPRQEVLWDAEVVLTFLHQPGHVDRG